MDEEVLRKGAKQIPHSFLKMGYRVFWNLVLILSVSILEEMFGCLFFEKLQMISSILDDHLFMPFWIQSFSGCVIGGYENYIGAAHLCEAGGLAFRARRARAPGPLRGPGLG